MLAPTTMSHLATTIAGISTQDAALVRELQAGSEDAFNQLIAQYHAPIYGIIARSLQNPADAPDVTQDVFIKVFRGIGGFHGDCSLRTWLYRIALHEASNQRRWWSRHKKQEITIDSDLHSEEEDCFTLRDSLADQRDSPFDSAVQSEMRVRVEAALREVPESFRSVLILREIEGMQYDEIADVLAINIGTVKSRLMRGRTCLRSALIQQDEASRQQKRGGANV